MQTSERNVGQAVAEGAARQLERGCRRNGTYRRVPRRAVEQAGLAEGEAGAELPEPPVPRGSADHLDGPADDYVECIGGIAFPEDLVAGGKTPAAAGAGQLDQRRQRG